MKSNIFDIRTKKPVDIDVPRNTPPGGIFMSLDNLMASIANYGPRGFVLESLEGYARTIGISPHELKTLIFIFDTKNSKKFLVDELKDKADDLFQGQVMYE